VNNQMALQTC